MEASRTIQCVSDQGKIPTGQLWVPDPDRPGFEREWDGTGFTGQERYISPEAAVGGASGAPPPARPATGRVVLTVIAACLLAAVLGLGGLLAYDQELSASRSPSTPFTTSTTRAPLRTTTSQLPTPPTTPPTVPPTVPPTIYLPPPTNAPPTTYIFPTYNSPPVTFVPRDPEEVQYCATFQGRMAQLVATAEDFDKGRISYEAASEVLRSLIADIEAYAKSLHVTSRTRSWAENDARGLDLKASLGSSGIGLAAGSVGTWNYLCDF
jgi:hypothetical protein